MSDIKTDFRKWLQNNFSKSTAYNYYALVQKIFDKNFDDSQDWQKHSEIIIPLLARYFEFANREYSLDRVTIRYALDYFDEILKFIYPKKGSAYKYEPTVQIYNKKSPHFYETTLYKLNDCLKYLACYLYEYDVDYNLKNINAPELLMTFVVDTDVKSRKELAIYINYESQSAMEKLAISKYSAYLQQIQHNNTYFAMLLPITTKIKTQNPNKTINGHYKIVQQISGSNPLIIRDTNAEDRFDINYTITKQDLVKIFDLDLGTIDKLLKKVALPTNKTAQYDEEDYKYGAQIAKNITRRDVIIEYETELRTYYNADNINEYLAKHHYCQHYIDVDYSKEGYKYWCNRKKAIEIVGVGKTAFFEHIWGISKKDKDMLSVSYINYTDYKTRYYVPEMKFLKIHPIFKRILYKK